MASADYRLCDKCKNKAFYDANLSYQVLRADEAEESVLVNGCKAFYKLGYLGDWAVLCKECSKTFECVIVVKEEKQKCRNLEKKPIVIEARQYLNDSSTYDLLLWINEGLLEKKRPFAIWENDELIIPTLEGDRLASVGDWIIKGVQGEFYSCKADIFEATYEADYPCGIMDSPKNT